MGIENAPLDLSTIRTLLKLLGVPHAKDDHQLTDLHSVFRRWISSCNDFSLEQLVRALLCTPGLGHLVSGIHSIGKCFLVMSCDVVILASCIFQVKAILLRFGDSWRALPRSGSVWPSSWATRTNVWLRSSLSAAPSVSR